MVATQFSFLKWNHLSLSLKKNEILTSGMLAAGQKTLFDMLAQLLNTFTWIQLGTVWCQMQITYLKHFHRKNFLERILVFKYFYLVYIHAVSVVNFFIPKPLWYKIQNLSFVTVVLGFSRFMRSASQRLMLVKILPTTTFKPSLS